MKVSHEEFMKAFEADVRKLIKKAQRTMKVEGMPIGWLPLVQQPYLHELLATGRYEIFTRPGRVNSHRSYSYVIEKKGS
jgi:hypothetical protein